MENGSNTSERYKEKIKRIVQDKRLCSMMNNTKWRKLKKEVMKLPFSASVCNKKH